MFDDAESIDATIKGLKPDVVIHLGAMSSPAKCESDPVLAASVNNAQALVQAVRKHTPHTVVVFTSTDLVYGGEPSAGTKYTAAAGASGMSSEGKEKGVEGVAPGNVYAKTKHEGELAVRTLENGIVLRLSNMIGTGGGKFLDFLCNALESRSKCGLRHDEIRSFVSVEDVVKLIGTIVQQRVTYYGSGNMGGTFNVGGPEGLSRLQLAQKLAAAKKVAMLVSETSDECSSTQQQQQQGEGEDVDAKSWHVFKQSNADAIASSGVFNPRDVSMDSSATEAAFGVTFQSMDDTIRTALGLS
jgi:dTDP-4-dehydrorhamnose reductase